MEDSRKHQRTCIPLSRIRVLATLANGETLRGAVKDISQQGLRVAGETGGLAIGDEVSIILIYPSDRKIQYTCIVKHVDCEGGSWSAEMTSPPSAIETQLKM